MPITPFLRGQAFGPEMITTMSQALTRTCETLRLREIGDLTTELVAAKIIELAQRGVQDVDTLCTMAAHELTSSEAASTGPTTDALA